MVFLDLDKLIETNFSPVSKEATLGDLVHIISSSKRNVFPVIKEGGEFAGIILLDDIRTDMFDQAKYRTPVSKYVVQPPDIIFKNEMISEVVEKFEESRAWNLPVVDKNNRYLGFVSKSSILEAYRQQLIQITEESTFPSSLRGVGCCVTVLRQLPGVFRSRISLARSCLRVLFSGAEPSPGVRIRCSVFRRHRFPVSHSGSPPFFFRMPGQSPAARHNLCSCHKGN